MKRYFLYSFIYLFLTFSGKAFSQNDNSETNPANGENSSANLEFSHPLITESISPDTKFRFTFLGTNTSDRAFLQTYDVEIEYAPVNVFSIHIDIPFDILKPYAGPSVSSFDDIELDLKFANFAFAHRKILLGYGISFGFPTGNQEKDIGNDHVWYVNPFFNGGIKWRKWEWTAFITLGIPANQNIRENIQTGLETRFTTMYRINKKFQVLLEAGNETQISRFYRGDGIYDLTEGIKFYPDPDGPWIIGIGARHPIYRNNELKFQGIFSLFYHLKD